ncbi:hypothetical protein, variant [Capsaspora owczarzaki ATCC 30864]|nr:hypothetical protein, variant [Capsaspora owczarzaki ATCC 30864]
MIARQRIHQRDVVAKLGPLAVRQNFQQLAIPLDINSSPETIQEQLKTLRSLVPSIEQPARRSRLQARIAQLVDLHNSALVLADAVAANRSLASAAAASAAVAATTIPRIPQRFNVQPGPFAHPAPVKHAGPPPDPIDPANAQALLALAAARKGLGSSVERQGLPQRMARPMGLADRAQAKARQPVKADPNKNQDISDTLPAAAVRAPNMQDVPFSPEEAIALSLTCINPEALQDCCNLRVKPPAQLSNSALFFTYTGVEPLYRPPSARTFFSPESILIAVTSSEAKYSHSALAMNATWVSVARSLGMRVIFFGAYPASALPGIGLLPAGESEASWASRGPFHEQRVLDMWQWVALQAPADIEWVFKVDDSTFVNPLHLIVDVIYPAARQSKYFNVPKVPRELNRRRHVEPCSAGCEHVYLGRVETLPSDALQVAASTGGYLLSRSSVDLLAYLRALHTSTAASPPQNSTRKEADLAKLLHRVEHWTKRVNPSDRPRYQNLLEASQSCGPTERDDETVARCLKAADVLPTHSDFLKTETPWAADQPVDLRDPPNTPYATQHGVALADVWWMHRSAWGICVFQPEA